MRTKLDKLIEKSEFSSNNLLGKAVRATWMEKEELATDGDPSDVVAASSVATYIGRLARGEYVSWWRDRPHALASLAEHLHADPDEIIGPKRPGSATYTFESFPELGPLNLRYEEPWDILRVANAESASVPVADRLQALSQSDGFAQWYRLPSGPELGLLCEWARALQLFHVVECTTLADAVEQLSDARPNLVRLAKQDPKTDIRATSELFGFDLAILAPFSAPESGFFVINGEDDDNVIDGEDDDSSSSSSEPQAVLGRPLEEFEWAPPSYWREQFAAWMETRLEGASSPFTAQGLVKWLEETDPDAQLFDTPSSLLSLGHYVHHQSNDERVLQRDDVRVIANWWLRHRGRLHRSRSHELRGAWLELSGSDTMHDLVMHTIEQLDHRLGSAETREWWIAAIPDDFSGPHLDDANRSKLEEEIVHGSSKTTRRESLAKLVAQLENFDQQQIIENLSAADLLRESADGEYELSPAWLVRWLQRETVCEQLIIASPDKWGRWCLAPDRRTLVDRGLDDLEDDQFEAVIRDTVDGFASTGPGPVAAMEATFDAVGRRLVIGWAPDNKNLLAKLARLQFRFLVRHGGLVRPMTRPQSDNRAQRTAWTASAWAWSVHVDRPDDLVTEHFEFDEPPMRRSFPGWFGVPLLRDEEPSYFEIYEPKDWYAFGRGNGDVSRAAQVAYQRLLGLAPRVLERADRLDKLERIENVFAPALIIRAARDDVDVDHVAKLVWRLNKMARTDLLQRLERLDEQASARAAELLWKRALWERSVSDFVNHHPRLATFVFEKLEEDAFHKTLSGPRSGSITHHLAALPPKWRFIVIEWELENGDRSPNPRFRQQVETLGGEDRESLLLLADAGSVAAIQKVWSLFPDIAFARIRALREGSNISLSWLRTAPKSVLDELLAIFETLPEDERPDGLKNWLLTILPEAGASADRVFGLLMDFQSMR